MAEDLYFGICPECKEPGITRNISRNHFGCCDAHRLYWYIGSNLFSCWRYETEEHWAANHDLLSGYREVEEHHKDTQRHQRAADQHSDGKLMAPEGL